MSKFTVPVRKTLIANAQVEVEADSLEQACIQVKEDIVKNGVDSQAAAAEFDADWENATDLSVGDVVLPDGRNFSARP